RAVTLAEVEAAPVNERVIRASRANPRDPGEQAPALPVVDGVTTVFGRFILGQVERPGRRDTMLASRTGVCAHLVLQSGRCAVADNEVTVREDMGFGVGEELDFRFLADRRLTARRLTVVGTYRYLDATDPFWAGHEQLLGVNSAGAMFTSELTLQRMGGELLERVDLVLRPEADPVAIRSTVEAAMAQLKAGDYGVNTDFLVLADRVRLSRDMLSAKLIGGVAPLVLVCWFVLFFAISSAVRQRREELGLYALRGVPTPLRLALPTLEIAGPVVLAAVPGYLLGHMAVALSYPDARITPTALIACGAALLGAVAAGVVAIFRRVRPRSARPIWLRAVEIGVATLALAVGYQAALSGEDAAGPSMLAPLCLTLGVGIIAARLLPPLAARLGRAMLRRGRATAAMSLLALARRPGTA
ncbi:FtsX-like permease family protein, partial [Allorhizocola rhizosphaerae]|uniref:FtsX-like permease family protein n=1 Tax=Allorhizocola rhizosphaerae TaxID=1872709 RepID=UPI0013C2E977